MSHHTEKVISGSGGASLDHLVQQLWQVPVDRGSIRVVVDPRGDPSWRTVESYWVLPGTRSPRLLVPSASRRVTAASLRNYGKLRPWKTRWLRNLLALLSSMGITLGRSRLHVQVRTDRHGAKAAAELPLSTISRQLYDENKEGGQLSEVYCSMGIRTGDNRKPTLQLIDAEGNPVGYAKLAWNKTSGEFIRTEATALKNLSPKRAPMRVPELLCSGTQAGFPFLVSSPLPSDVRAVRGAIPGPSSEELFSLSPIQRVDRVGSSGHFKALLDRLTVLAKESHSVLASSTRSLAGALQLRDAKMPIASQWHGDLVPWNTAREANGQLWCWDWESADADAVAGLDAVHWMFSVLRESGSAPVAGNLRQAVDNASRHLQAAGIRRENFKDLAGVYALVVAERAWTLAKDQSGWESAWISEAELVTLVDSASQWLEETAES